MEFNDTPIGNRTGIDWSKHEMTHELHRGPINVHTLKQPGTVIHMVVFTNTPYGLSVHGDFGNWVFCHQFIPNKYGYASDSYWHEKLQIASTQSAKEFDPDGTVEYINELIDENNFSEDELSYLNRLIDLSGESEFDYDAYAYRKGPGYFSDYDRVPKLFSYSFWFRAIMDAYEEMCRRIRQAGELYYIRHNSYVGNAIVWWGVDGDGYTTDINKAGKYTKQKAVEICNNRYGEDTAYLCSVIDTIDDAKKVIIDAQYVSLDLSVNLCTHDELFMTEIDGFMQCRCGYRPE